MMNVGIFIAVEEHRGGIYQYTLAILDSLRENDRKNRYFVFEKSKRLRCRQEYEKAGWTFVNYYGGSLWSLPSRLLRGALRRILPESLVLFARGRRSRRIDKNPKGRGGEKPRLNKHFDNLLKKYAIDLMLYPTTEPQAFETSIPYIIAIHDLQHKLHPEFPEVSARRIQETREYIFKNASEYAAFILADSETGKEDIINAYGISSEKVKVLPYIPAYPLRQRPDKKNRTEVKNRYSLPDRYLFYPANFWPHKNHYRLVEALFLLRKEKGVKIPLVLVGFKEKRWGEFTRVMRLVARLNMEEQVKYLGYVPKEDIPFLYSSAEALVMPTFFGPTNIPIYEAWVLGVPVVTSDVRGIREQVGDAGILVNPESIEDMAEGIHRFWTDERLREDLVKKGFERAVFWTEEDFAKALLSIINEFGK